MENSITLSVHQLVDFLLRTGDIDSRVFNNASMQEGTLLHALYQSKQGDNYISEYPLKETFPIEEFLITLEGRSDGIIKKKDSYIIDEIKTAVIDLKEFRDKNLQWHLGQAKCYALMFMHEKNLSTIGVRLTYISQNNIKDKLIDDYTFCLEELEQYVYGLLNDYLEFYNITLRLKEERNESIKKLTFPFDNYRKGQREFAKYAYSVAKNGGRLFCEAPTGIGKTMSSLFPFIKSLTDNDQGKIFYLTAKNSGKDSAEQALNKLRNNGLSISSIDITAKEKICFMEDRECNPDDCPYAKDYYKKIQALIRIAISSEREFTHDRIVQLAKENVVCPFEMQLDISLFTDVIICDYNYAFDPVSYLKRFFDEDFSHSMFLIDEAHNLVDRSKDMYSAYIEEDELVQVKFDYKHIKNQSIKRQLNKLQKVYDHLRNQINDDNTFVLPELFLDDFRKINSFDEAYSTLSEEHSKDILPSLRKLFLNVHRFRRIGELVNSDNYVIYIYKTPKGVGIKYLCLNPSKYLKSLTSRIKSSVFFSATLSPSSYYLETLGGEVNKDPVLHLASPFPRENLKLLVAPKLSVKYKNRDSSYKDVARYIKAFISHKVGNYLIYLPSYEYLDKLSQELSLDNVNEFFQSRDMSDIDKEAFLANFVNEPKITNVGFAIIGGSFGEGIDLVSDRLIGAVIVGIGMPKINFESDEIMKYYNYLELDGYDFAYLYPGMNKVMQAVGRVIRSESDRGAVLLIDERYTTKQYQDLFRNEWKDYEVVLSIDDINEQLSSFFEK